MLEYAVIALGFAAAALAVHLVLHAAEVVPPTGGERRLRYALASESSSLFPFFYACCSAVGGWLTKVAPPAVTDQLGAQIQEAGHPGGFSARELLGAMGCVAVALAGTGALLSPSAVLAGAVIGAALPIFRIKDAIQVRKKLMFRTLPVAIDLVALCLRAGMDFHGALRSVARRIAKVNPLHFEFEYMAHQVTLGRSKYEVLQELANRAQLPEIDQFVGSVIQSEKRGTPLAETLSLQASIMRTRRSQAAEQAAAKAAVKMMGPLMLIFLAIVAVIAGPIGLQIMQGGM